MGVEQTKEQKAFEAQVKEKRMNTIKALDKFRPTTIDFPTSVQPTPCKTFTQRYVSPTTHGVIYSEWTRPNTEYYRSIHSRFVEGTTAFIQALMSN